MIGFGQKIQHGNWVVSLLMIHQQTCLQSGISLNAFFIQTHASYYIDSLNYVLHREVFQCSVLISFWRVRHAWHKKLVEKCTEIETRADISRRLGEIVTSICRGNGDVDSFEAFMEDFVDCSDFLDYFKAIWCPRIGQVLVFV